jgi:hypothetical protein
VGDLMGRDLEKRKLATNQELRRENGGPDGFYLYKEAEMRPAFRPFGVFVAALPDLNRS